MPKPVIFEQMERERVEAPLHYGPLPLNLASAELSGIVNDLLQGKTANFSYSPKGGLTVEIEGKTHNISLLLETADLSQLMMDRTAMGSYAQILQTTPGFRQPDLSAHGVDRFRFPSESDFRRLDHTEGGDSLLNLSYAEMLAINIYTTNFYDQMNPFLRGNMQDIATAAQSGQIALNRKATELLLSSCLAASGLSRAQSSVSVPEEAVRGDSNLPKFILDQRIKAVRDSQAHLEGVTGVTPVDAFTSSSFEAGAEFDGSVHTMFYNLQGKKVAAISAFPHEREFLIPPVQIQWTAARTEGSTVYLMGRPVNTPDSVRDRIIIEKHTEFAEYIDEINHTLQFQHKINQLGLLKTPLSALIEKTRKLAEEIRKANATILFGSDLSSRVQDLRHEVVGQIGALVNNDIAETMRELESAMKSKLENPSWFSRFKMWLMGDKDLLEKKNAILLSVKTVVDELLAKPQITLEDLKRLSEITTKAIKENKELIENTNKNRILFKASAGRTGEILNAALNLLHTIEPSLVAAEEEHVSVHSSPT